MGELPRPPKLKLTPRQRAFLAGELYPSDEPYEQPPRIDEETRQRNLQGIEDARAALHSKKPYKEGTEGMWALAAGRLAGGAVAKHVGTKTGSSMVGRMAGSLVEITALTRQALRGCGQQRVRCLEEHLWQKRL